MEEIIKYLRVSVTTMCNADCWYCFNESQPFDFTFMKDVDGFEWFINELTTNYKTEIVRFTGGEPLLNSNLSSIIKSAKKANVKKIGLTTNGDLLLEKYEEIIESGIDEIAIHLHQLDANRDIINQRKIFDYTELILKKFKKVKFNIVVTKLNISNVNFILNYAMEKEIDLLLLDLLQAGVSDSDFYKSYQSLDNIRSILINNNFEEKIENYNSKIYSRNKSNIKLVEHYRDVNDKCSYCTKKLEYHPILLTPNFNLSICSHFGIKSFSVKKAIEKRDSELLKNIIITTKAALKNCNDCFQKNILIDKC